MHASTPVCCLLQVPKAFKIIPNLQNWEEILYLTEPENWSPHAGGWVGGRGPELGPLVACAAHPPTDTPAHPTPACLPAAVYQATRMFVSNLSARMAQRFLALVLLPHVRRDIRDNRRLHFALFQSLRKATYKPGAFYKGLLLPLCVSGSCTLREAVIFTSVIRRTSIPVLHSAAALLRIAGEHRPTAVRLLQLGAHTRPRACLPARPPACLHASSLHHVPPPRPPPVALLPELPYSGTNSFFIRVLLDKKYALPYRVVDGLVDHFTRFASEERMLPVVWHQALLCFVQRCVARGRVPALRSSAWTAGQAQRRACASRPTRLPPPPPPPPRRYKTEIRREDKDALRRLLRHQHHYQLTPEVLRELDASRSRGERGDEPEPMQAISKTVKGAEDPRALAPLVLMED